MSEEIKIIELKELDNALDLLMDFNREIKIYKTEEEMKQTSEKFLKLGNPIGIVQEGKLIVILIFTATIMKRLKLISAIFMF